MKIRDIPEGTIVKSKYNNRFMRLYFYVTYFCDFEILNYRLEVLKDDFSREAKGCTQFTGVANENADHLTIIE